MDVAFQVEDLLPGAQHRRADRVGAYGSDLGLTPTLDALKASCPFAKLKAHGTAVGMPSDDDMGNSEVGHNALGCGRVFDQGSKLVSAAIASGSSPAISRPSLSVFGTRAGYGQAAFASCDARPEITDAG